MYLNHKDLSKYWCLDIEADDLKATKIHIVCATNAATGETLDFVDRETFNRFVDAHQDCFWVGHNAISYDLPTLVRLWGSRLDLGRCIDTLVLSYLYDPQMVGGHGLAAWGERFGLPKIDFHDFSKYSPEMLEYCRRDVELTLKVFKALTKRMRDRGWSERSCKLEHDIRVVLDKQERNGFYFDIPGAQRLREELDKKKAGLETGIYALFPPELVVKNTYQYRTNKDGGNTHHYTRHLEEYPKLTHNADGTYDVWDYQEFNIGSPKQRLDRLLRMGFKPTKKTKAGGPSVDEDSLLGFAQTAKIPEAAAIAEWLVLSGRSNMLGTWLACVDESDSRMRGRVFTCGASTRRMTHSSPNTANIPKAHEKVPYGKESRALWAVHDPQSRRLVGYDAAGLEMRMFAHYLGNREVADLYINGDPHQVNADLLSIDRSTVKNVFYAFLYGAANEKLGTTGGHNARWGKNARGLLIDKTPGLKELVALVQQEQASGLLETIDGGKVRCPSPHAALNYKLQSAGGIVMKQASIFIDERVQEKGLDSLLVGSIHDEGQHDTAVGDAEEFGKLAVQAIRDAGEELGFSVPLDGSFAVGTDWSTTH